MGIFSQAKIIFERRNGEESIQVIQRSGKMELRFGNHIVQSQMSITQPDNLLLEYTQAMMVGFALHPEVSSTLQIGLGAGAIARFIHRFFPTCHQDIVEISPDVVEVARLFFRLPTSDQLQVYQEDGLAFVNRCKQRYDLVFQDAYLAEGVPGQLQTQEYMKSLREILAPGGWLVKNVWGSNSANLKLEASTLSAIFPVVYSIPVGVGTNVIFFATSGQQAFSLRDTLQRSDGISEMIPFHLNRWVKTLQRTRQPQNGPLAEPLARIL